MAKRKSASYMTPGEQIAGTVFFVIYLVVLPFATASLRNIENRDEARCKMPSIITHCLPLRSSFFTAFWAAPPGILRTI